MKEKILTLIPSLFGGGAEKFVADTSFKLSEEYKHEILLYNYRKEKYTYGGNLTDLNVPKKSGVIARAIRQFTIYKQISNYKKSFSPQVTISHMLMANMLNLLTIKKGKVICVLHGEWSVKTGKSNLLDALVKRYYAKADMIVSVSHYIDTMFQEYYKLNVPHKVAYIGVNIEEAIRKSLEKIDNVLPENYIVYVAGFRPVKNHIKLIEHLEAYLKQTDISLVLVGDGELRAVVEEKINNLSLQNKVILTGNLTNPYPVIKNAQLSLQVSSSESFSLVLVESMSLGTPVIATDCGGPRELIDPEWRKNRLTPLTTDFGVLIATPSEWKKNELVTEINTILSRPTLQKKLSDNAILRAEAFSLNKAESSYLEIINSLL